MSLQLLRLGPQNQHSSRPPDSEHGIVRIYSRADRQMPAMLREFPEGIEVSQLADFPLESRMRAAIREILRTFQLRPDFVIVDKVTLLSNVVAAAVRMTGGCAIVRVHGGMWHEFADDATIGRGPARILKVWFSTRARDRALRQADLIVTVSEYARGQILTELVHLQADRVVVIPEPIAEVFSHPFRCAHTQDLRRAWGIPPTARILFTATSFVYGRKWRALEHYHVHICEALDRNPDWFYVVAGDGPKRSEFEQYMFARVNADLRSRVRMCGFVSNIKAAMSEVDVVLHLSFRDTAAQTVKEAQACGRPVVVNRAAGMAEFIAPSLVALGCILSEDRALYGVLTYLMTHPKERAAAGRDAQTWVLERYTARCCAAQLWAAMADVRPRRHADT